MNKKVIESICQNAKLKKSKKFLNLRQMSKVGSMRNPPLLVRGGVVEWKPLRELNIGIIEFKLIGLLALNIRLSSPNPFFKKHAVKNMIMQAFRSIGLEAGVM